jgi:DNA-binding XRE family transcriptional regulator
MQVKNNLKDILDSKGIKYSFVAEQIGMAKGTFSNLLKNKYSTSLEYAFKIAEFLEMRIDEIFYYDKS